MYTDLPSRSDSILLVEAERDIARPLGRTLVREGYDVSWVGSGREVLDVVDDASVDCVILGLTLPDMDGIEVCRTLRENGYTGAVLMVTSRSGELDCVVALDSGADDYVRKPYGLAELLARVRAVMRRNRANVEEDARAGSGLRVDVEGRRAYAAQAEIQLTNKEFGVLAVLEAHRDKVVSRRRLMTEVWDENWFGSTKTLDVTIARLRGKLEDADLPDRIMNVRGVGFRLEQARELVSA